MRTVRFLIAPLLSFLFLVLGALPLGAFAQVQVKVVSPPKAAAPGDLVTHVFSITNPGTAQDTYGFSVTPPEGWSVIGLPGSVALSPGGEETIFVTVIVPQAAAPGEFHLVLTATSQTDPAITGSATALIQVVQAADVKVIAPEGRQAERGEEVTYSFIIINRGNILDIFAISAESSRGFAAEPSLTLLELLPKEQQEVAVILKVPKDARPGTDWLTVKATSTTSPVVAASATVTTTILPPLPEEVRGTLFLEVPAALDLGIIGSFIDGESTIPFSFHTGGDLGGGLRFSLRTTIKDLAEPMVKNSFSLIRRGVSLSIDHSEKALTASLVIPPVTWSVVSSPASRILSISVAARANGVRPSGEFSLSTVDGEPDNAFVMGLFYDLDGLLFGLRAFRFGPNFPRRHDQMGMSFSLRVSLLRMGSFTMLLGGSRDNVDDDPTLPTLSMVEAQATLRLSLENLFSFGLRFSERGRSSTGPPPPTDDEQASLSLLFALLGEPISISLLSSRSETSDHIAGTRYEVLSLGVMIHLRGEGFLGSLGLGAVTTRDALTGLTLHTSNKLDVALALPQIIDSALFRLAEEDGQLTVSSAITKGIARDAKISLGTSITTGGGNTDLSGYLAFSTKFSLPLPFKVVKGTLEGSVFIDENSNGLLDPGEQGVPDLILAADGARARTNSSGFYRFAPLLAGRYKLDIEELPLGLFPRIPLPLEVHLEAGEVLQVDIPLEQVGIISGVVFNDENRNGRSDRGERGLPRVRVMLMDTVAKEALTGPNGWYAFTVPLGEYVVRVDEGTLPARFELTTAGEISVVLSEPGERVVVNFGAAEKRMKLRFAPTADFTFSPAEPKPGEVVTFDASASYDPDGQIVKYEWDFESDGIIDARGTVVTHTFTRAGDFPVTLTVTDDSGMKGVVTKTVTVG